MIERTDAIGLSDSYGNKWALDLIETYLDDNIDDDSAYEAMGLKAGPESEEMKEFWWTLEHSRKKYDHEMNYRLEAMIRLNNVTLHILNDNNRFPHNYILWENFAPLAWFNFEVSK